MAGPLISAHGGRVCLKLYAQNAYTAVRRSLQPRSPAIESKMHISPPAAAKFWLAENPA